MNKFQFLFKRFVLHSFCIIIFSNLYSNSIDNELWTGIEIQKDYTKKFNIEVGQYIRFKDQFSQFHKTYTDVALAYQLNSIVDFSVGYRYLIYDDKTLHRVNFDSKINIEKFKYIPDLRISIQKELPHDEIVLRHKLTIEFPKIKKFSPYCLYEGFYSANSSILLKQKYRLGIGVELNLPRKNSIKFYYYNQSELDKDNLEDTNIWGTKYEYLF